jgi:hypothetical protein
MQHNYPTLARLRTAAIGLTLGAFLVTLMAFRPTESAPKDEKAVKAVINSFFEALHTGDTTLLRSTCTAEPIFQTFMANREGKMEVYATPFADFVAFVGTPTKDKYREDIRFESVLIEKSLASVWTPYTFSVNDKLSHCGTNSFQLVKTAEGWKIQYIIDTRRRGCKD